MMNRWFGRSALAVALLIASGTGAWSQSRPFSFGVIIHRSPTSTAEFWNPILRHVSERSGVRLQLKVARTGPEHTAMVRRGELDFLYSNHNFIVENGTIRYAVFARPRGDAGQGEIVVPEHSPIHSLADLQGKDVVFPHAAAFLGYHLPMDALLRQGVHVTVLFAGNQEGAMGQLKAGRTMAAGVSAEVMRAFARRERFTYRVLWRSERYLNLAVSARSTVPDDTVRAVREAFLDMAEDAAGAKVLATSAAVLKEPAPLVFIPARDEDFENMRRFYRTTRVKVELQ